MPSRVDLRLVGLLDAVGSGMIVLDLLVDLGPMFRARLNALRDLLRQRFGFFESLPPARQDRVGIGLQEPSVLQHVVVVLLAEYPRASRSRQQILAQELRVAFQRLESSARRSGQRLAGSPASFASPGALARSTLIVPSVLKIADSV